MTFEELQREYEDARRIRIQAKKVEEAAYDRLMGAKRQALIDEITAAGVVLGVTRVNCEGRGKEPFVIIGAKDEFGQVVPVFAKLKKDGTPSAAGSGVSGMRNWKIAE